MKRPKKHKAPYKGPFPNNPNLPLDVVRKSMRPESDGPTVDLFSELDSTTDLNKQKDSRPINKRKRPTNRKFEVKLSFEKIVFGILSIVSVGIGIIVYTHGNKFVSVEKDVEYIKEDMKEQKEQTNKLLDKTNSIDKKVDLLNQKIELKSHKK